MAEKTFRLTEEHLTLLRAACVGWCGDEYGAPAIDPKRPYGNSGVAWDIAAELGWEEPAEDDEPAREQMRERAREIHEQTETALRIVVQFAGREVVRPGLYREVSWNTWTRVGD